MAEWCTIESDPGVFTEIIKGIGIKNVIVEELFTIEDENYLKQLEPIHGFIFMFKWIPEKDEREYLEYYDNDLFFANQVIQNACATQAILAILLNSDLIALSEDLIQLKNFTKDLDSQMKGLSIGNSSLIRNVHNSFAKPEPFIFVQSKKHKKEEDAFHFVSYIPFKNNVYEIDGLKPGPYLLGNFTKREDWIPIARKEIQKRIFSFFSFFDFYFFVIFLHDLFYSFN